MLVCWQTVPHAQAEPFGQPSGEVRFLFLVDCSLPMAQCREAVAEAVRSRVLSGLDGQMHEGDLFTIWPFSAKPFADRYLPMRWDSRTKQVMAARIARSLKSQLFNGQAQLDEALRELGKVVLLSDSLTTVIISTTVSPISQTPFDKRINGVYRGFQDKEETRGQVVVTTLQAEQGEFVGWSVEPLKMVRCNLDPPARERELKAANASTKGRAAAEAPRDPLIAKLAAAEKQGAQDLPAVRKVNADSGALIKPSVPELKRTSIMASMPSEPEIEFPNGLETATPQRDAGAERTLVGKRETRTSAPTPVLAAVVEAKPKPIGTDSNTVAGKLEAKTSEIAELSKSLTPPAKTVPETDPPQMQRGLKVSVEGSGAKSALETPPALKGAAFCAGPSSVGESPIQQPSGGVEAAPLATGWPRWATYLLAGAGLLALSMTVLWQARGNRAEAPLSLISRSIERK
jgi:hypothetical protein